MPIPNSDSEILSLSIFHGIWTKYIPTINNKKNAPWKQVILALKKLSFGQILNQIKILNELARKENASEGIELNEGMTYADFLTNQLSAGLYSVPQTFVVEDFVKKRLKERAELT